MFSSHARVRLSLPFGQIELYPLDQQPACLKAGASSSAYCYNFSRQSTHKPVKKRRISTMTFDPQYTMPAAMNDARMVAVDLYRNQAWKARMRRFWAFITRTSAPKICRPAWPRRALYRASHRASCFAVPRCP